MDSNADVDIGQVDSEDVATQDSVRSSEMEESQSDHGEEEVASNQQMRGNSTPTLIYMDGRSVKLFKSPKKVSPTKKRLGKQDMMKVAFQYLTNKTSTKRSASVEPVYEKAEEDEYDIFGRLLAKQLRQLDNLTREYAIRDINNIMFEAKMYP